MNDADQLVESFRAKADSVRPARVSSWGGRDTEVVEDPEGEEWLTGILQYDMGVDLSAFDRTEKDADARIDQLVDIAEAHIRRTHADERAR